MYREKIEQTTLNCTNKKCTWEKSTSKYRHSFSIGKVNLGKIIGWLRNNEGGLVKGKREF